MKPARPVNLFDLPPAKRRALEKSIDRHPAANRHIGAGPAATAAPPATGGTVVRWRCHHCGEGFTAWAPAERHRHPSPFGGDVGRIELVLS